MCKHNKYEWTKYSNHFRSNKSFISSWTFYNVVLQKSKQKDDQVNALGFEATLRAHQSVQLYPQMLDVQIFTKLK